MKLTSSPAKSPRWLREPADRLARECIFVPLCGQQSLERDKSEVYKEIRQRVREAFWKISINDTVWKGPDFLNCPSIDDEYEQGTFRQCDAARICPFCFARRARATFISVCQAAAKLPTHYQVMWFHSTREAVRTDGGELTHTNRAEATDRFCAFIRAGGKNSLALRDLKENGCVGGAAVDHHISLDRPDRVILHRFGVVLVHPNEAENWQQWTGEESEDSTEHRRVGKPRDLSDENLARAVLKVWQFPPFLLKAKPNDLEYYLDSNAKRPKTRFYRTYGTVLNSPVKQSYEGSLRLINTANGANMQSMLKHGTIREIDGGRYEAAEILFV